MSLKAWLYLLCLSFIWGASFYFIEVGLGYLDVFWLVSLRLVTGALALFLWVILRGVGLPRIWAFWRAAFIMGLLNNVIPFCLIAYGQKFVTGGMASIINANTAFMGVIISALFLVSEPAKWNRVIGVVIGIFGVVIVIGIDESLQQPSLLQGQLAIVLATISYALAGVWGRLNLGQFPALQGATGMLVCSSLLCVLLSLIFARLPETTLFSHPADLLQLIIGIGLLGTALAYPLYFKILDMAGASNLMLVTIIVPLFAVLLDALLLGQLISRVDLGGFLLVALGLLVMDGRLLKAVRPLGQK